VLYVCSNWWAKCEMGGTDFKWGVGITASPPLATALAVKRRLKLRQTKPKAEKEKGALEKNVNRTTSEIAQKAQEEPHHSEDGDIVDS